jgi:hypothetical protein
MDRSMNASLLEVIPRVLRSAATNGPARKNHHRSATRKPLQPDRPETDT